jgi:hypothetical protein
MKESGHIRRMAMEESQGSAFLQVAPLEAGFGGNNQIQIDSKLEGPILNPILDPGSAPSLPSPPIAGLVQNPPGLSAI